MNCKRTIFPKLKLDPSFVKARISGRSEKDLCLKSTSERQLRSLINVVHFLLSKQTGLLYRHFIRELSQLMLKCSEALPPFTL